MNLAYKHILPDTFSPTSRVWIYQSSRLFSLSEALEAEEQINAFAEEWKSHGADVDAFGNLLFGQFVVLMADETKAGVSGCSTDRRCCPCCEYSKSSARLCGRLRPPMPRKLSPPGTPGTTPRVFWQKMRAGNSRAGNAG